MKFIKKPILFLFLSYFILSFTTEHQIRLKTGFYYLAEKGNEGELIKDIDSKNSYAVDKTEALTSEDFNLVKVATKNLQPNPLKVLEIKLTKNGRKKWAGILNRINKTGESILFICNNTIYLEKTIIDNNILENSRIDLFIEPKYQQTIFEIITSEISDRR